MLGAAEIAAAITAGNAAISAIKTLAGAVTEAQDKAEAVHFMEAMVDLGATINTLQAAVFELRAENEELRRDLAQRQADEDVRSRLDKDGDVLFLRTNDGGRDGAYCPACFGNAGKLVYLQNPPGNPGLYFCALHERTSFHSSEYIVRKAPAPRPRGGGPGSWMGV